MRNLLILTQTLGWLIFLSVHSHWADAQELEPPQLKWFATEINPNKANIEAGYPAPELMVSYDDQYIIVQSNGIPTFEFVQKTPNDLRSQDFVWQLPRFPQPAVVPTQIPLLGPIAITTTGLPIYGPNEAHFPDPYGDPYVNQILDYCHGHTGGQSDYHFHAAPECLIHHPDGTEEHFNIIGFALDGYPIIAHYTSVLDADGIPLLDQNGETRFNWLEVSGYEANEDYNKHVLTGQKKSTYAWNNYKFDPARVGRTLDQCNGRDLTEELIREGVSEKDFFQFDYAYFVTGEFPYFLAKYKGAVRNLNRLTTGQKPKDQGPEQGHRPKDIKLKSVERPIHDKRPEDNKTILGHQLDGDQNLNRPTTGQKPKDQGPEQGHRSKDIKLEGVERPIHDKRLEDGKTILGHQLDGDRLDSDQRPQDQRSILYLKPLTNREPIVRPHPLEDSTNVSALDPEGDPDLAGLRPKLNGGNQPIDLDLNNPDRNPKQLDPLERSAHHDQPPDSKIEQRELGKQQKLDPTIRPQKIQQWHPVMQAPLAGGHFPIGIHLKSADAVIELDFRLTYDPTTLGLVEIESPGDTVQTDVDIRRLEPGLVLFRVHHVPLGHAPLAVAIFEVIEGKDSALGFDVARLFGPDRILLPVMTRGLTVLKWHQGRPQSGGPSQPGGGVTEEIAEEMVASLHPSETGENKFELLEPVDAGTQIPIDFAFVTFVAELSINGIDSQTWAESDNGDIKSEPISVNLKPGKYLLKEHYFGKLHAPNTPVGSLTMAFEEVVVERSFTVEEATAYHIQINAEIGNGWAGFSGDLVGETEIPKASAKGIKVHLLADQDLEAGTWIELYGEMRANLFSRTRIQRQKPIVVEPPKENPALVSLDPSEVTLPSVGAPLQLDVLIENAHQVSRFVFKLVFNPDVLAFDGIKLGNFLPEGAEELVFPAIFEPGVVSFGAQVSDGQAEKTEGKLATITFKVLSWSKSKIGFSLVELSDSNGRKIPVRNGITEVAPPNLQETIQWRSPLRVESQDSELKKQELWFGVSTQGTSGFDIDLDELAPPTPHPPVKLYAYWKIEDELVTQLVADYRSQSEHLVYQLEVRADQQPFTLHWDASPVPDRFASLKLRSVNQEIETEIDMRMVDHATFPAIEGEFYTFEVIASQRIKLHLFPGWNMISLPGTSEAKLTPKAVADQSQTAMHPLFRWNPAGQAYKEVEQFGLGEGYWFLTLNEKGEEMDLPVTPVDSYTIDLKTGWNLIGSASHVCDFSDPQDVPNGSIVPNSLFEWESKGFTYNQVSKIEPGKGYWVLTFEDCRLTVGGNKVPASPQRIQHPETLIPLVFISGDFSQKLEIGYDVNASDDFESMDWPMPPLSPVNPDVQAYLVGDLFPLWRDIKSLSRGQLSWKIQFSSGEVSQLTVDQDQLPQGKELVISDGQTEIILSSSVSAQLKPGRQLLTVLLRDPIPNVTQLLQNYPNPFNPETWIPFELSQGSEVRLTIYDTSGRLIRRIDLGFQPAGTYLQRDRAIYWDGRTPSGEQVASGTYFYTLKTADYTSTQKMIILK